MTLVDTTVWIDLFNGRSSPECRAFEDLLRKGETLCLTDLVLTEILRGFLREKDYTTVKSYLARFPCLSPKPFVTYVHAADLYRTCRKRGVTVRSTIDCVIAAVCIENKASLLHHDADFERLARCTRLQLVHPTQLV